MSHVVYTLPDNTEKSAESCSKPVLVEPKVGSEAAVAPAVQSPPPPRGCSHLPHGLQLLLLVFVGGLKLLHLPLQLLLLRQQLLPELFPTLAGFFVWWGAAQLQQVDSRMNGWERWRRENRKYPLSFVSLTAGGRRRRRLLWILPQSCGVTLSQARSLLPRGVPHL